MNFIKLEGATNLRVSRPIHGHKNKFFQIVKIVNNTF
jgi:hypothetical protein